MQIKKIWYEDLGRDKASYGPLKWNPSSGLPKKLRESAKIQRRPLPAPRRVGIPPQDKKPSIPHRQRTHMMFLLEQALRSLI